MHCRHSSRVARDAVKLVANSGVSALNNENQFHPALKAVRTDSAICAGWAGVNSARAADESPL